MKKDFHQIWDNGAEEWDSTWTSERNPHYHYYRTTDLLVIQLLRETGAKQALELGCGTAGCSIYTLQNLSGIDDLHITGIDISPRMIDIGQLKVSQAGLADRITLHVGDVTTLPYPDESFDMVFSRGVVMSYVDQPERLLREAQRVLRVNGVLGLDVMNKGPEDPEIKKKMKSRYMGKIMGFEKTKRIFEFPREAFTYYEFFTEDNYQVFREYSVRPDTQLFSELEKKFQALPQHLPGINHPPQHLPEAELISERKNRLFDAEELQQIVTANGFQDVKVYGLGYMISLLRDEELRSFVNENRDYFCKAEILLQDKLRLDYAVHLFVSGQKSS
ncbi:MAG: class I SAM-dependent methyltransferase [Candidatus Hodarchaeales archaeon]|jgi:ubiquinone/menaquinone biosynthesis C-methylase UbiE